MNTGQRAKHGPIAGNIDRADASAGRDERPDILTAEPPERAGDNRHLAIEPEHLAERAIPHLFVTQLFVM